MTRDLFSDLEDPAFFEDFVYNHLSSAPHEVERDFACSIQVDRARIKFAHSEYVQNIRAFKVLLHSENPDHYKRSGALLHALYKSKAITEVSFSDSAFGSLEAVEADHVLGLSYDDAQDMTRYPRFFNEYHNELMAFDLAYQCCAAYEEEFRGYDIVYLHNVCFYLWKNDDLSVDSFAIMFRALMH